VETGSIRAATDVSRSPRIYKERDAPTHLQWFWAITSIFGTPSDLRMDGHAPTLESAKAQLGENWRKWLSWAKLTEIEG